jgi:flagellar biogenesis protein FliO
MSRLSARTVTRLAAALLVAVALTGPAAADVEAQGGPSSPVAPAVASVVTEPVAVAAPPSAIAATLRAAGATTLIALVLAGALMAYRRRLTTPAAAGGQTHWWRRLMPEPPSPADRIEMLCRLHLGHRESLGVVRVGRERMLVGVTTYGIRLLARLEASEPAPAAAPPPVPDFTSALAAAEISVPRTSEDLREALARSRERLERLSGRRVVEAGPRG